MPEPDGPSLIQTDRHLHFFPVRLEAYCAMAVVKANDKVLKKRVPANHIKMHAELGRETYLPRKAISSELESHRMQIDEHEAPITDLDIGALSTLPIQSQCSEPVLV